MRELSSQLPPSPLSVFRRAEFGSELARPRNSGSYGRPYKAIAPSPNLRRPLSSRRDFRPLDYSRPAVKLSIRHLRVLTRHRGGEQSVRIRPRNYTATEPMSNTAFLWIRRARAGFLRPRPKRAATGRTAPQERSYRPSRSGSVYPNFGAVASLSEGGGESPGPL